MAKIEPITFPGTIGTATDLNVFTLGFNMDAKKCMINYDLSDGPAILTEPGQLKPNSFYKGQYLLTEAEYNAWGADNNYIVQLIADKLGVTLL